MFLSVRGLLLWGLLLAVLAWLGAAKVVARMHARRAYNTVTWTDCVLWPLRWDEIRQKRGRAYIKDGLDDFRQGRWREGAGKISAGLSRAPDGEGRRELASFFLAVRARPRALSLLLDGLEHGGFDRAYFDDVIATAMQGDDFEAALEACARAERRWRGDGTSADARWLMERHLAVLVRAGRAEEALRLRGQWKLETVSADEVCVAALVDLKRFSDALELIDGWERRSGVNVSTLQLRAHVLATKKDREALGPVLKRLRAMQGDKLGYYVFATGKWLQAGDQAMAERAFEDFRLRVGDNQRGMEEMGAELARHANLELIGRCIEVSREYGYTSRMLQMQYFDACVIHGDWDRAVRVVGELVQARSEADLPPQDRRNNELLKRFSAALASEADGVQRHLVEFCRGQILPLTAVKFMHSALMRAGRYATARDLVEFSTLSYPGCKALGEMRAEAAARAEDLTSKVAQNRAEAVAAYVAARGERTEAEVTGVVAPAGETEFFAALAAAREAKDWPRVLGLVTSLRYQRPAWLAAREADVLRAEIAVRRNRGEGLELVVAVRSFLNGTRPRSEEALALAREIDAAGDRTLARTVVTEIVRKTPDYAEAADLLKAWTPPATGKPAEGAPESGRVPAPAEGKAG